MKLVSEGKVSLEMDEIAALKAAAEDDALYRYKMLENSTKTVVLMGESCKDHREFRTMLRNALVLLAAIAAAIGVPLGVVL